MILTMNTHDENTLWVAKGGHVTWMEAVWLLFNETHFDSASVQILTRYFILFFGHWINLDDMILSMTDAHNENILEATG